MSETKIYGIRQWCTNPRCQITMTTGFRTVVYNICGYSVWNLLHVTILVHRILRLLQVFGNFVHLQNRRAATAILINSSTQNIIPPFHGGQNILLLDFQNSFLASNLCRGGEQQCEVSDYVWHCLGLFHTSQFSIYCKMCSLSSATVNEIGIKEAIALCTKKHYTWCSRQ